MRVYLTAFCICYKFQWEKSTQLIAVSMQQNQAEDTMTEGSNGNAFTSGIFSQVLGLSLTAVSKHHFAVEIKNQLQVKARDKNFPLNVHKYAGARQMLLSAHIHTDIHTHTPPACLSSSGAGSLLQFSLSSIPPPPNPELQLHLKPAKSRAQDWWPTASGAACADPSHQCIHKFKWRTHRTIVTTYRRKAKGKTKLELDDRTTGEKER